MRRRAVKKSWRTFASFIMLQRCLYRGGSGGGGNGRRAAAAAVAGTAAAVCAAAGSRHLSTAAAADDQPTVLGAVILFRHGARSAIFQLPESVDNSEAYATINGPPTHAHPSKIVNGKACHRFMPPSSPGYLTELGWQQGEALGRRLRRRYGERATIEAVKTTDTSRTMLTAHAVLTGFFDPNLVGADASAAPAVIEVVRGPALAVDIGCSELALSMGQGRAAHRALDAKNGEARAALAAAFADAGAPHAKAPGLLAALDDCQARRAHGISPSFSIESALCDVATREAAREVRAALRYDGFRAAKLAAGRLCELIVAHLAPMQQQHATPQPPQPPHEAAADSSLPSPLPPPPPPPKLLLLSGHDTSLMGLITALSWPRSPRTVTPPAASAAAGMPIDAEGAGTLLADGVWPPHCACIAIELLDTGSVRVLYQFEPLYEQTSSGFLGDVRSLASSDSEHEKLCRGSVGGDGAVFNWAD
jgi:hypothetical protein